MKKVMLALVVLISLTEAATAQKGSILVYGNIAFGDSSDMYSFKSTSYIINPGIGYQLNDKWTAGLNFAFGDSRNDNSTNQQNTTIPTGNFATTSFFNMGPFLRYTYSISNVFSIYGQGEINYLSGKVTPAASVSGSYTGVGLDFFPAISVNIKKGFALNLSFGGISYQSKSYSGALYTNSTVPTSTASQFAITFGQGATFGISKNFGGSKKN